FEIQPPQEPPKEQKELTPEEKKKQEEDRVARERGMARRKYDKQFDDAALDKLRSMGVTLIPLELPKLPYQAMRPILLAEAAAPKPIVREGELQPGGPGTPVSLTFLGQLYGEAKLLAFAKAYQDATGFHLKHPALA